MIGNSLFYDLAASLLGIDTLWLKDNDEVTTRRMVNRPLVRERCSSSTPSAGLNGRERW
jgi:FMN phosphatase YigB (HAD superfamily)